MEWRYLLTNETEEVRMDKVLIYFALTMGIPVLCAIIVSTVFFISNRKKENKERGDKKVNK